MTTQTETRPWDFSHVFDLVKSLSSSDIDASDTAEKVAYESPEYSDQKDATSVIPVTAYDFERIPPKLGDFGKIWQYLGTPLVSPAPQVPPLVHDLPNKLDYTSDGATYFKTPVRKAKEVTWLDYNGDDEPATDTMTDGSSPETPPDTPSLTKTQRKKQRRKERKAKEAAATLKSATVSESEADNVWRRTPARAASAHFVKQSLAQRTTVTEPIDIPVSSQVDFTQSDATVETARNRVADVLANIRKSKQADSPKSNGQSPRPGQLSSSSRQQSNPVPSSEQQASKQAKSQRSISTKQWPVTPTKASALRLFPSSVQPPARMAAPISHGQPQAMDTPDTTNNQNMNPATAISKPRFVIEPKIVRSGEDRHWALLMKLINDFWEDRKHLISPMNLTTHNNDPRGIHVFVDASNIFIGFNDQLKRSRGIPQFAHLPSAHVSFDGLALLMERRRPVAKRVLCGSTPHLPAFDKAEAVGYECSILDKVYKARELTDRQIYFKDHDRSGRPTRAAAKASASSTVSTPNSPPKNSPSKPMVNHGNGSGSGSGSEMTVPQYAPARMIEQGVDEILHLKILESVVDSDVPSTIVLATGDAAQAEYSPGFMAMLERALKKGWKVEIVSWSRNISGMYRKKEFLEKWGGMFRVVYLDDYAEELLEM
ncbi:hypothetical protein LTR62_000835 [Meristemomyces frigidus]|uniref:NYN domain-containing protein n=1 Tax=Meristemomyces frigidus TaxID=1508187 RepID=A0AAN7TM58_9PEZI|nr:hypothetical protein LTR62_000835 [Meristemomyces frigidus]